jgi:cell division initiation protein
MTLTPVELRHVDLARRPLGYSRRATDRLLDEIYDSFEEVWRNRADLADRIEQLESDLVRYRELETLLRATLVSAERSAQELRDQAHREAELILSEAHAEARAIGRGAVAERERIAAETHRIRTQLQAALGSLEPASPEADGGDEDEAAAA